MSDPERKTFIRKIRSFVRREGRLTRGQQRGLEKIWPQFGIEHDIGALDLDKIFGRTAPRILEIGFGNGASLAQQAQQHPEMDFLGIEVHRPGVGNLLQVIEREGLTNIRLMQEDAVEILREQIPLNSLDKVQLFFPDPWHKKKHHKRRIVQLDFAALLYERLKQGGIFHMATDWQHYAEHMLTTMNTAPGYRNMSESNDYVPRPESRPITKFEKRGHRLGHGVWDLMFAKDSDE